MKRFGGILTVIIFLGATFTRANSVVHTVGVGAQAYSMANNYTALVRDYSATYWNPAGLAFLPIREVQIGIMGIDQEATTTLGGTSETRDRQRVRLGSAGFVRSIPTSQGGFAFAVGFSNPYLLDDIGYYHGNDTYTGNDSIAVDTTMVPRKGASYTFDENQFGYGQFDLWNGAVGWQVAPGFGIGVAAALITGKERKYISSEQQGRVIDKSSGDTILLEKDVVYRDSSSFLGYDFRLGLLYKIGNNVSVGARLEVPRYIAVSLRETIIDYANSEVYHDRYRGDYRFPMVGALGVAATLPYLTVTSDVAVRTPHPEALESSPLGEWKKSAGIGIEVPIRPISTVLRGGYAFNQLDLYPMKIEWEDDDLGEDPSYTTRADKHLFTAGVSVLAQEIIAFEAAYGYSFWEFSNSSSSWKNDLITFQNMHRAMFSVSFRY
jgi:hypothetical protein